ncbi:MAG: SPOR domain-containing protein [Burkholderiales bacterium]|nr:SPOR domain-containing protein [Burkholderiales bacterium]
MARNVSDEELQLKKRARRRLVGAIVLVTAVAVVLPMILDSEPKPATQSINIQIPSPEAGVLTAKPAPLKPAEKPAMAAAPAVAEPAPAKAEAKVEPRLEAKAAIKPEAAAVAKAEPKIETGAEAAAKPQSAPAPAKAVTKTESSAKAKAPAGGGFVIQVAALSDAAKARELQAKIAGGGLKSYTEVVQTAKGPVTRVRVGPYASREAAEKARPQLQKLQLDGKVIPR